MAGAESMQLTRAEFEERGKAERLKLPELIALLSIFLNSSFET